MHSSILDSFLTIVKEVECTSSQHQLYVCTENETETPKADITAGMKIESRSVPFPSEDEMNSSFAELNSWKFKAINLCLVPLQKKIKIFDLHYHELLQFCFEK